MVGLMSGFIGWMRARPGSAEVSSAIGGGMLVCAAALALDFAVAALVWETVKFQALR
jgi:hypothetical protein